MNRLFFACFHAGRAVLLIDGFEARRHGALRHLLALHFVKRGLLPASVTRILAHLADERELADYVAGSTVSAEEYESHRVDADHLLDEMFTLRMLPDAGNNTPERSANGMVHEPRND